MKMYTETGGRAAGDLDGVIRRMVELGATEKERVWTGRWVSVVRRWCEWLQRPRPGGRSGVAEGERSTEG